MLYPCEFRQFISQEPKYTIMLGDLMEYYKAHNIDLFDFPYQCPVLYTLIETPQEDEVAASKKALQDLFVEYYRFNEVAAETPDRFKQRLAVKWRLKMQRYYGIFEKSAFQSSLDVFTTSSVETSSKKIDQDTPQNQVNLNIDENENFPYASFASSIKDKVKGRAGVSEAELLELYYHAQREAVKEFFDSLDDLFLQIY